MKMTDKQAIELCTRRAELSLSMAGGLGGEQKSRDWTRIRAAIEEEGLDAAYEAQEAWVASVGRNTDPRRTADTSVAMEFMEAVYDNDLIDETIAYDIREKVEAEIDKTADKPLRHLYLTFLRDHLTNVIDGAADLMDFEDAIDAIETQLTPLELEYSKWITEARAAQEDE
jgi:hypothetical protein